MADAPDPLVACAERLCETLDRIGDALVSLDAATLLETEDTLEQLLSAMAAGGQVQDADALARLTERAAAALQRCRRLGASFSGMAGTRLRLRTGVETYGKTGDFVEPAAGGIAVKVMT
jgi:hypothetical protein